MFNLIDNLKEAKKIVEAGWCQRLYAEGDNHCAVGAIYAACKNPTIAEHMVDVFIEANKIPNSGSGRYFTKTCSISVWNDLKTTTKQDVINAFDKAIEHAQDKSYDEKKPPGDAYLFVEMLKKSFLPSLVAKT